MHDLKTQLETLTPEKQIEILLRRLGRSEQARLDAESLLERRARELDRINSELRTREEILLERLELGNRQLLAAQRTARIATMHRSRGGQYQFSPEFAVILGRDARETVGPEMLADAVHPLDRKRVARQTIEFLAEVSSTLDHTYEHRIIRKSDREVRWLRWTLRREIDSANKWQSVFGTVQDITEQRRTERRVAALGLMAERRVRNLTKLTGELEEAQLSQQKTSEFLRAIMDAVPQGIAVFDPDLKLVTWNSPLAEIIEFDAASLKIGLPFEAPPVLGADQPSNAVSVHEIERDDNGKIVDKTFERNLKDGRIIQVNVVGPDDGTMIRIYSDVTRYKQVELELRTKGTQLSERVQQLVTLSGELRRSRIEAETANRYKSRFLAMMSHDIRTPMNGILGMLETLADSKLDTKQARQLELAKESGKQLNVLLNDIIEIVRAEAGKLDLQPVPLTLSRTIEGITEFWGVANTNPAISLHCELGGNLPVVAMLDPVRFRQLIDNLLSNALKYTGKGRVRLRAFAVDSNLRIEVVDEGPGISEEQQKGLFMDFNRLQNMETTGGQSAGLGLAICRRLVEAMDGRIGVSSKVGKGSTFWFEIPLAEEGNGGADTLQLEGPAPIPISLGGSHVLVAEDVETNREVIKAILEQIGCTYDLASNGIEAIELLQDQDFQLVLMDVNMPEMDGIEATRAIRSSQADYQGIPIIGVTAHVMREEQDKLLAAGMDALVPKPIDREMLYAAMRDLLGPATTLSPSVSSEAGDHGSILDMEAVSMLLEAIPEARREAILCASMQDISQLSEQLVAAKKAGDADATRRAKHSLIGVAGNIGASRLAAALSGQNDVDAGTLQSLAAETLSEIRRAFDLEQEQAAAQ
ncbi:PAS domain-containing hybrid sensor histidine kinase/response regulator [Aurantiacibacter marinus]|uniref:PAS domain-containing hybrid sensor histidine kinase/response regulator n=1 Tax=Aurantiacibacter marinus TaxID=874156 RepID=UPI00069947E9|nr:ATP-binding protein [Aurantiacibacter marinus]